MESQDEDASAAALQSEINYFMSIPWCRSHICEPNFHPVNRPRKATLDHGHTLLGKTWFTKDTLPHLLTLHRQACVAEGWRSEICRFHAIGTGLNEHPGVFHGGAIATVLDSALGILVKCSIPDGRPAYTVVLNITYKKAIKTPGTIMARSWITKMEGRKVWACAQIETSTGEIHATAEGIFVKGNAKI
ncbi:hypothetical protein N7517_000388 [Penicillium concentricum]|uniref:Thioesterase domain-containing protein n=1 Tax=Penicillium concentricum TaxID=293559 RepID=A0A9W9SPY7_9EURO|nr:uncharacterized protein N7517_000388 [Penicillium concentricum]KAJ5382477.1 hypothetical protein N7517_000388 [Penicillium concentricum]